MKALLKFRITTCSGSKTDAPEYANVKLFKEDGLYVWRFGGEFGDEVEQLPKTKSVEQAKIDARLVYGGKDWQMNASWR